MESFAENRAEAIRQHEASIKAIDGREVKAAQELAKRHGSLAGRLSAFTRKGRQRQERERQGLAEKFEQERFKKHRDLAALQERQTANEQKARLRNGQELKAMREGHVAAREKQHNWQHDNRDRLIQQGRHRAEGRRHPRLVPRTAEGARARTPYPRIQSLSRKPET